VSTFSRVGKWDLPSLEGTPWAHLEIDTKVVDIVTALENAATRWPERTVWTFVDAGGELTYAQLYKQVRSLAYAMAKLGVGPRDRVATLMGNIPEFVLTWFALAYLRAVIVPLNPRYTPREIDFVATDSDVSFIVLEAELEHLLDRASATSVRLRGHRRIVVNQPGPESTSFTELLETNITDALPNGRPELDDVHTIQFTSGTTGLPKGCLLTHG
jgi:acyl-CoA synthetase (AMP-forming)/AMP-acid ligase II